jgi:multiple sugar transport system substrate-binding protein
VLPNDATAQREQLIRRLAAEDSSIDLMSLDPAGSMR